MQAGIVDRTKYATRKEAQREADRLNADAEQELGCELLGDGAASVIEVTGEDVTVQS